MSLPLDATEATLSQHAQEILKITRDTEFLQSFLRVDHGETDSEPGDYRSPVKQAASAAPQKGPADDRGDESGGRGRGGGTASGAADRAHGYGHDEPRRPHHKATFKEVVKELEASYGGLGALASKKGKKGKSIRGEEVYTDKDRAAAVQMGSRDIKQSLRMKRHQERVRALQLPEEADSGTLIALGHYELRQGHTDIAIAFVNKALQLNPEDKTALVARSKCYLLLGQPRLALQDAETALGPDRNFVRAIFQKAEALYHLGDFEHSLMYYHRGLRLRPELAMFRLGVQKAQEAIENTIGTGIQESCQIMEDTERGRSSGGKGALKSRIMSPTNSSRVPSARRSVSPGDPSVRNSESASPRGSILTGRGSVSPSGTRVRSSRSGSKGTSRAVSTTDAGATPEAESQSSRHLLGELCIDKVYLEQLLKHPDIKCAHRDRSSQISSYAEDGVEFLRNRQEFWRQQKLASGQGSTTHNISVPNSSSRNSAQQRSGRSNAPKQDSELTPNSAHLKAY